MSLRSSGLRSGQGIRSRPSWSAWRLHAPPFAGAWLQIRKVSTRRRTQLLQRSGIQIQRNEFQQFLIVHLGQQQIDSTFEQIPGKVAFGFDERVDFLFYGSAAQELLDKHIL